MPKDIKIERNNKGQFVKGFPYNKGVKKTKEHRKKLSKAQKGKHNSFNTEFKKGEHFSYKTEFKKGQKIRLGVKHTEEAKRKNSKAHKGKSWGNHTEEAKRRISKKQKGQHHSIKTEFKDQGKKSFEPYSIDWTRTLRRSIRERDHYICQLCQSYGNTAHHIDYDKKNCDPKNLITLCRSCNSKVNFNRKYWTKYFKKYE